jgi:serine/threonine-protein kinase HipA
MPSKQRIYVYIHLPGTFAAVPAARLDVETLAGGAVVGRFRYGDRYLARDSAIELDPIQLPLSSTVYEFSNLGGLPSAVRDASPDAWGRRVIEHKLQRAAGELNEVDYLIHGAQDSVGCLTFGLNVDPPGPLRPYNQTHQLADLIAAAAALEDGKATPANLLERIETSLGGARPKATIEDAGQLWLAKFPQKTDRFNLQRVEYASLRLARKAGLNVCVPRIESIGNMDVLMLPRFDRSPIEGGYARRSFVSGFTVLQCDDGTIDRRAWSYLKLADALRRWAAASGEQQLELFRRMVFNAAVTNDDDHPRNHGLLRGSRGWALSPAYDIVPSPKAGIDHRDLALDVGAFGRTASIYNLLSECGRFGLNEESARHEITGIIDAVKGWRESFHADGVSAQDVDYIQSAFIPECFLREEPPQPRP